MIEELVLIHQFTDRAGREVYAIHDVDECGHQGKSLGQIRFKIGEDVEGIPCVIDWAKNEADE